MTYDNDASKRGERIRHAIKIAGRPKLMALAASLDVSPAALSKWRYGQNISLENICRLALQLDVSLDWLLLERGSPKSHRDANGSRTDQELVELLTLRPTKITKLLTALVREIPEKHPRPFEAASYSEI
ncbi:MAG: helix-turn-helix domain-containing protein [Albidovulum sp.]|uniref:helix-turn-helix domain-containing protein n=1 Tax=Albidovulum sp. TaxID=1872424 RepID=UPI003CA6D112